MSKLSEEEIKMLEEYVQEFNENKKKDKLAYSTGFGKFWSNFVKAIENLINRNKQLEEIEKEHKKENGELREQVKEIEKQRNDVAWRLSNLTEKIEGILNKYKYTELGNDEEIINFYKELKELLQEGDK